MKIEQLEYFLDISHTQSLNKSAQRLFITQPGLTKSIQKLEEEIGASLFTRDKTGIFLNDTGRIFKPYAEKMLETYHNSLIDISQSLTFSSPINIYTLPIFAEACMPTFLNSIYARFPNLTINLIDNPQNTSEKDFFSCLNDHPLNSILFFTTHLSKLQSIQEDICRTQLATDSIAAFYHYNHPFRHKKTMSLDFLCQNKSMVLFWNTPFIDPADVFSSVSNLSLLKNMVLNQNYIVCLSQFFGELIFKDMPITSCPLHNVEPVCHEIITSHSLAREFAPVLNAFTSIAQFFFRSLF